MKIIGHRGAMGYAFENSLSSFNKALELGVDLIELDIYCLKTGELVVFHDDELDQLTNSSGNIEECTLRDLKTIRLNNGEPIPLLSDILHLVNGKTCLNIELKGKDTAIPLVGLINFFRTTHQFDFTDYIFSSFDWNALVVLKSMVPELKIGLLAEDNYGACVDFASNNAVYSIHAYYETLTNKELEQFQAMGLKTIIFTTNNPLEIAHLDLKLLDGIISDFPDRFTTLRLQESVRMLTS